MSSNASWGWNSPCWPPKTSSSSCSCFCCGPTAYTLHTELGTKYYTLMEKKDPICGGEMSVTVTDHYHYFYHQDADGCYQITKEREQSWSTLPAGSESSCLSLITDPLSSRELFIYKLLHSNTSYQSQRLILQEERLCVEKGDLERIQRELRQKREETRSNIICLYFSQLQNPTVTR